MKPELTPDEQEAMALSGKLANAMRKVIGEGPQKSGDWREVAHSIHDIQARIMSQVGARAGVGRPLGGRPDKPCASYQPHEEHPWDGETAVDGLWWCPGVPLPEAHGNCTCECHRFPGVSHVVACCYPGQPFSLDLSGESAVMAEIESSFAERIQPPALTTLVDRSRA